MKCVGYDIDISETGVKLDNELNITLDKQGYSAGDKFELKLDNDIIEFVKIEE
jgi:hypothetical protein